MTFPSLPSSTLAISNPISFPAFMKSSKKRSVYRTPLLDRVLDKLEQMAKDLRADVDGLPIELLVVFADLVKEALTCVVGVLRDVLNGISGGAEGGALRQTLVHRTLFVGRTALFLARQSTFLSSLTGSPAEQGTFIGCPAAAGST